MKITSLSVKGQVVIPKDIRSALNLKPGDKLEVEIKGKSIIFRPVEEKIGNRLFGRFKGTGLISALEEEHLRELSKEDV